MTWSLPILIALAAPERPASYRHEVVAVFARAGCNGGACHGNLNGKGGFRLSLRGEDPALDYLAISRGASGRRIDVSDPRSSLILRKAAGQTPHEGGVRFAPSSPEYALLLKWVAAGARDDGDAASTLTKLAVTLERAVVPYEQDRVAIRATATFSDGSTRDVTRLAAIDLDTVGTARVTPDGVLEQLRPGETVALVRYLGATVPVSVAFVPDRPAVDLAAFPVAHPVDRLAAAKWAELRLAPAPAASDALFLRRATLDATGQLPTADQARAFLADARPDKRARLIDDLLDRPAYADYWALKWADLLRVEEKSLDKKGVRVFHRWLRDAVAADKPLTELAAAVLAGRGSTYENPPANFYRALREPYGRAEAVAQVFLGLRVGCAKCHNHPFDRWTQTDYHRFAAVFARVDYQTPGTTRTDKLDKHEFIGDQVVYEKPGGELDDPRGGVAVPQLLGTPAPLPASAGRLDALAGWVASPGNPHFARAQANRVWLHLFGRGLVDPGDDFRATNPATNPELLDHLSAEFARAGYRLKPLIRHVMTSATYARGPGGGGLEVGEFHHFSRAEPQALEAEQLLDAVGAALGAAAPLPDSPAGTRAGQLAALPQAGRRAPATPGVRFLRVFGKPERLLTCECERSEDPGVMQAFQLLTGEVVRAALAKPDNRLGKLIASGTTDAAILDELYLAALSRPPTGGERVKLLDHVAKRDRRQAWEDVAWGLVNSREFQVRQ